MSPTTAGLRVYQGKVIGPASWPAIHEMNTWAVMVKEHSRPERKTITDASIKHLLTGIVLCFVCGSPIRVTHPRGYLSYSCSGKKKAEGRTKRFCATVVKSKLDDFVEVLVIDRLKKLDAAEVFDTATSDRAVAAVQEAADLRAELETWYLAAEAGDCGPAIIGRMEAKYLPLIESAERRAVDADVPPILHEFIGTPDVEQRWDALLITQRRLIIPALFEIRLKPTGRGRRIFVPEERLDITPKKIGSAPQAA